MRCGRRHERVRRRVIRWFRMRRLLDVFQASPDELPVIDIHSV